MASPGPISNGSDRPLFARMGTVPDVSGALTDYFQAITFETVSKAIFAGQVVETGTQYTFQGILQPFSERQLLLRPEGQRAWTWFTLHADPVLTLQVDDVIIYKGKQTRVMSRKDYYLYSYVEYSLVQDWTGSDPTVNP